jgi:carbamoyltransferase
MSARTQIIIGHANTIHDPAISIVVGDRVFAEGLERHTQCKRAWEGNLYHSGDALVSAFSELGMWPVREADVRVLSTWDPDVLAAWKSPEQIPLAPVRAQLESITGQWRFESLLRSLLVDHAASLSDSPLRALENGAAEPDLQWSRGAYEHHLMHAANAVLTSLFEECVVMVLDGFGERSSSEFFHFQDGCFRKLERPIRRPIGEEIIYGSFGTAYAVATTLCGFVPTQGEEWKLMGLAAHGNYRRDIHEFFRDRTRIDGLEARFEWLNRRELRLLQALTGGFRTPSDPNFNRAADLAHNFQRSWSESLIEIAQNLDALGLSKNLAYGGGCALNSAANGEILDRTTFNRLHVPSAPADDGNALGAALYELHCVRKIPRTPCVGSPYLGSSMNLQRLERILSFGGLKYHEATDAHTLCDWVTDLLVRGNVVGWVQGRAEFGPRALGNRSILADPRRPDMKERINGRVKFREAYRPLAPSVLHEHADDFFENYQESPYMERALRVRADRQDRVPAVVHVDGTARVQTVRREWNPLFHDLIGQFHEKTGVPMLVNTSLNVMGKPIVHSVEDALAVLYTTALDNLVIGPYVISK